MPKIAAEFDALTEVAWIIVSFMLTQTAGTPLWGRLSDRFGRRSCLIFSVGMFTVWSLACGLSTTIEELIIFRAMQGIGGGGIMSCVMIVLADLTPPSSRAAYMAPLGSMFALSSVCGPLLGGFFTDYITWRWAFFINVPIGIICIGIQWFYIPKTLGQHHLNHPAVAIDPAPPATATATATASADGAVVPTATNPMHTAAAAANNGAAKTEQNADGAPAADATAVAVTVPGAEAGTAAKAADKKENKHHHAHVHHSIDYYGSLFIIVAVICLCLALTWGGSEYPWNNGRIIALLTIAIAFVIIFILIEMFQAKDPIIPMRLFRVWNFSTNAVVNFMTGMSLTGGYVFLPIYFQLVQKQTASESGISMIPMMLGLPVGAVITGILVTKTGSYRFYPVLGGIGLLAANILYTQMDATTSTANQVGFLILGGVSMGPLVQVPLLAAQNAVAVPDMAVTSSTMQFFQATGGLLSTAAMQTILNNRLAERMGPIMAQLAAMFPGAQSSSGNQAEQLEQLRQFAPAIYQSIMDAYAYSVSGVFNVGIACCVIVIVSALMVKHIKLRDGMEANGLHAEGALPPVIVDEESHDSDSEGNPSPKQTPVADAPEAAALAEDPKPAAPAVVVAAAS